MKSKFLLPILALGFGLVACDDYTEPTPAPQENPQLEAINPNIEVSSAIAPESLLNLQDLEAAGTEDVAVAKVEKADNMPEGYSVMCVYQMSFDEETYVSIPTTTKDNVAYVTIDQIQAVYEAEYGQDQEPFEIPAFGRVVVYITNDRTGSAIRLNDKYVGEAEFNLQAMAAPYVLYTPGNSNGWTAATSQVLTSKDNVVYTGFAYLNGEFKFADTTDWSGINYGAGEKEDVLSTDGTAGNLNAPEAGLYYCQVDIAELTYKITLVTSISVGEARFTPSADFLTWKGTVTVGDAWNITVNEGEDAISLGGRLKNVVVNGTPIHTAAGTYAATLAFGAYPYTVTLD